MSSGVTAEPIAVAIVTYNSAKHVAALLDSLPAAFGDVPRTTVVVDNGSSDATVEIVAGRTDCQLVRSTNTGYASGINRGVRQAAGRGPILILNPDATLDPGAVPTLLRGLATPGVGIVAPRMLEADGSLSPTLRRGPTMGRAGGLSFTGFAAFAERIEDPREYESAHVVDWAVGAVLLVDRACYDAVGGLDESYFLYSEETDFCLRARDLGWQTLYWPQAQAMHVGGGSGENATTHTMKMVNRVRLYRRRTGPARSYVYLGLTVLNELRRAVLGHSPSWQALRALLRPAERPAELGASGSLLPS